MLDAGYWILDAQNLYKLYKLYKRYILYILYSKDYPHPSSSITSINLIRINLPSHFSCHMRRIQDRKVKIICKQTCFLRC